MDAKKTGRKAVIVMDNGGGCTLILGKYQHNYNDMSEARRDAVLWEGGASVQDWDGDESSDYPLDIYSDDFAASERAGGYKVYHGVSDIDNSDNYYGTNVDNFKNGR
jgi:hypothetical protein